MDPIYLKFVYGTWRHDSVSKYCWWLIDGWNVVFDLWVFVLATPRLSSYSRCPSYPDDFDLGKFDDLGGLRAFGDLTSLKMSRLSR